MCKENGFVVNATNPEFILNVQRLPAILSAEQAAVRLGIGAHDIPTLCANRLLRPLGNPTRNAPKQFAASDIEDRCKDLKWLGQVTNARTEKWRRKNSKKPHQKMNPNPQ